MANFTYKDSAQAKAGSGTASLTCAYNSAVNAGDLLVAFVIVAGNRTITCSDSLNGAWTKVGSEFNASGITIAQFHFINSASGAAPTVTATPNSGTYITLIIARYQPAGTVTFDASIATQSGTSTAPATGTCTATAADLVVCGYGQGNATITSDSVGSPFTNRQDQLDGTNHMGGALADDVNAAGNEGATWTLSSSQPWAARAASYKSTSGSTTITVTDSGSGADILGSISVSGSTGDSGSGNDTVNAPAVSLALADLGVGADALAAITAAITAADAGGGVDQVASLIVSAAVADSSVGADVPVISALLQGIVDSCVGADSIFVSFFVSISDTGQGADSVSPCTIQLTVAESCSGNDLLAAIAVALSVADASGAVEGITVHTTIGNFGRVVTITFTALQRSVSFAAGQRSITFKKS